MTTPERILERIHGGPLPVAPQPDPLTALGYQLLALRLELGDVRDDVAGLADDVAALRFELAEARERRLSRLWRRLRNRVLPPVAEPDFVAEQEYDDTEEAG